MATKNLGRVTGKSAYEVWLAQGNKGTEQDFLNSLKADVEVPTKLSELDNDKGFITENDIPTIPTKTSQLTNDSNFINAETDPKYTADKPNIALKSELPTKTSDLTNDNKFVSESFVKNAIAEAELNGGDVDLSGYATKDDLLTKVDKETGKSLIADSEINRLASVTNYDDTEIKQDITDINQALDKKAEKTEIPTVPTKVSELTNDSGFITGYTETDPKYTADKPNIALKSEIPTKVSDLTNDRNYLTSIPSEYVTETELNGKGYLTSYTETDPKYTADKDKLALKTEIPTKVSDLTNDKNYLTSYTETDPTVPSWAKATTKPSYTKSEVGLGNVDNVKQYSASNPPPYPVTSVNGDTGAVTVRVPTKTSQLTNDSGFVDSSQVNSLDVFSSYNTFAKSIVDLKVNPNEPLNIETYDGSNKPTHPCGLYIPEGWNGHKYWLAYTPFPGNDNTYENPCLAYSDDGIHFSSDGLTNPIENTPMENGVKVGFNSDVHIAIINGVMECWWRTCQQKGTRVNYEIIYRKKSTDGINWTAKEELYAVQNDGLAKCLSPVVRYINGKYCIWYAWLLSKIVYCESADGTNWQEIRRIDVDQFVYPDYKIWHFDILYTENAGYEFVGSYRLEGDAGSNLYVFYATSKDNVTYTTPALILTTGESGNFDDTELYRPSILRDTAGVKVYYGCRKGFGNWSIGLLQSPHPILFNGIIKQKTQQDSILSRITALEEALTAIPCTSIVLNTDTLSFTTSETQQLTATVEPSDTTYSVEWSVSPTGVVNITQDGRVSPVDGVTEGECVVTAKCGNQRATCNVTVYIPSGNLLDGVSVGTGSMDVSTGEVTANASNKLLDYFDVSALAGTEMLIYGRNAGTTAKSVTACFFDSGKKYISGVATTKDTKRCLIAKVPSNAKYMRIMSFQATSIEIYTGSTVNPSALATRQSGYYDTSTGEIKAGSSYVCYKIPVTGAIGFAFASYLHNCVIFDSAGAKTGTVYINTANTEAFTGLSGLADGFIGITNKSSNADLAEIKMPSLLLGSKTL